MLFLLFSKRSARSDAGSNLISVVVRENGEAVGRNAGIIVINRPSRKCPSFRLERKRFVPRKEIRYTHVKAYGRYIIDKGWQFQSRGNLFFCILFLLSVTLVVARKSTAMTRNVARLRFAFHAFPISRFAFPSLFCTFTSTLYVARKLAYSFTIYKSLSNRHKTLPQPLTTQFARISRFSAIRLWSLVSTKNIYNILNSNDRYVDSWFKNLNKLIRYIYYITYIVCW